MRLLVACAVLALGACGGAAAGPDPVPAATATADVVDRAGTATTAGAEVAIEARGLM